MLYSISYGVMAAGVDTLLILAFITGVHRVVGDSLRVQYTMPNGRPYWPMISMLLTGTSLFVLGGVIVLAVGPSGYSTLVIVISFLVMAVVLISFHLWLYIQYSTRRYGRKTRCLNKKAA